MEILVVALIGGLTLGATYMLMSLGLVLAVRATGTLSFTHGQFMLIAALFVAGSQYSNSTEFTAATLIGLAVVAVLGAIFYLVALQWTTGLDPFIGIIATLGLASVLDGLILFRFGSPQYQMSVPGVPAEIVTILGARISSQSIVLSAFALLLAGVVAAVLRYTQFGRRVRAAGQDPVLASQGGIGVRHLHLISWALAAVLSGVAGIVYGATNLVDQSMIAVALTAFPAILIGGLDSIDGAIVGGLIVGMFQSLIAAYLGPELLEVLTYVLLLMVLLVLPDGLFGTRKVARV